jgi:hypothetical protein
MMVIVGALQLLTGWRPPNTGPATNPADTYRRLRG